MHRPSYTALIDLVISSEKASNLITNYNTTDKLRSDHTTVLLEIAYDGPCNIGAPPSSYRKEVKIKSINFDILLKEINFHTNLICYPKINSIEVIDSVVKQLTISLQASIESATVEKSIKIDPNKFLVLPSFIVDLIKKKRKLR